MKCVFATIFLLLSISVFGTNRYVNFSTGNDANAGTIGSPWKTVAKVNSSTFSPGDSVLFAGSQTHPGGLKVPSNGVIIASYGTGQATISGLTTLTGWVSVGTNIWESVPTVTLKNSCNVLTVNGTPYAVGRTPNINYFTYQSANVSTMTSATLIAPYNNMVGAEAVIRKNRYLAEKVTITAQSGTTITYVPNRQIDNNTPNPVNGTSNYGFFLQRFAASLDIQNEWWLNTSNGNMRIYSTVSPNTLTVKASYIDTVIYTGTHTNVTIHNIAIEGAGLYGIYMFNGSNITIKNCTFNNNTRSIYSKNGLNVNINNNTLNNNFESGIVVGLSSKQINIIDNTVTNTGQFIGNGLFWSSADLNGMLAITDTTTISNFINVIGNTVRTVGHMGIDARGSNLTVRRNIIDSFANQVDDAGGFYTWVARTTVNTINYTNRVLDSNFVSNGIGAYLGTANTEARVKGLYIDDQSLNWLIKDNTVWNIPDNCISMNNPKNVIFTNNTLYNNKVLISLVQKINGTISGNRISRNILYQKLNTGQENFFHQNDNLSATGFAPSALGIIASGQAMAVIDTNWISNQLTNGYRVWYSTNGSGITFPPAFPLQTANPSWRSSYFHDLVSVLPPVTVTNTNTTLHTNPSNNLLVVNFPGLRKRDPKGVIYDHTATVGRWASLILIDDGNAPSGGNTPPTVSAGVDKLVTLPTNSTSVTATSTLGSGASGVYTWSELSGPNTATNSAPSSATTTFGGLIAGTYQMKVKFLNNLGDSAIDFMQIQVNAAPIPPIANAGIDQTVQLPTNSTTVSGGGSSDVDGTITTYAWAKISGPTGGTINTPNAMITAITSMIAGVYTFRLTVTDNSSLTSQDFIQITVNAIVPPVNQPPVAEAGASQTITLPTNTTTLDGTGSTDADGTITGYLWRKISGPSGGGGAITTPTNAITGVTGLIAGIYIYQLRVTDNNGDTAIDALSVTINSANVPPTVNAGEDQTITLPTSSVSLEGTATDVDGTISSVLWTKISGPTGGIITSSTSLSTTITGLTEGQYIFNLRATDNTGDTAVDAILITVNPAPPLLPPVADAGIGQTIILPTNSVTLTGIGTDQDGTITGYQWVKISGGAATIVSPTSATTDVTGLVEDTYQFELTVTDNDGLTGKDTVEIIVNPIPVNIPPVANSGGDQVITDTFIVLNGAGSDNGGTIVSYQWVKISGPVGDVIANPTSATTLVSGLQIGVFVYELTVTDDDGNTATDIATITVVSPVSQPVIFYRWKTP